MALNRKITIVSFCSVLLIAMVVGVAVTNVQNKNYHAEESKQLHITNTRRAVSSICKPTLFRNTCENKLFPVAMQRNSTEPKEMIKAGFDFAIQHIQDTLKQSTLAKEAEQDPRTAGAYKVCEQTLDAAVNDFRRSIQKVDDFDIENLEEILFDIKVWLSAAGTAQSNCLDAFEQTTGDAGEKMKNLLTVSRELTMNGYNMVDDLARVLREMNVQPGTRKLLQAAAAPGPAGAVPAWVKNSQKPLLVGDTAKQMANATVAADGSGKFKSINEALKTAPQNSQDLFIVYIKAGVYNEAVRIENYMTNVVLVGDGPTKTNITGAKSVKKGSSTLESATVEVLGFNFIAKDIGMENTAGADQGPAVALDVGADKSIFVNCRMDAYQDTLFARVYRQFYSGCSISGTIDFVFGDSVVVFQGCTLTVRKPAPGQANNILSSGREVSNGVTAIIVDNCTFAADAAVTADPTIQNYLGRPWKDYSKMIVMNSDIGSFVNNTGWSLWADTDPNTATAYIGEYNNKGPGADVTNRIKWPSYKKISPSEASSYKPATFLKADEWIKPTGLTYS